MEYAPMPAPREYIFPIPDPAAHTIAMLKGAIRARELESLDVAGMAVVLIWQLHNRIAIVSLKNPTSIGYNRWNIKCLDPFLFCTLEYYKYKWETNASKMIYIKFLT